MATCIPKFHLNSYKIIFSIIIDPAHTRADNKVTKKTVFLILYPLLLMILYSAAAAFNTLTAIGDRYRNCHFINPEFLLTEMLF